MRPHSRSASFLSVLLRNPFWLLGQPQTLLSLPSRANTVISVYINSKTTGEILFSCTRSDQRSSIALCAHYMRLQTEIDDVPLALLAFQGRLLAGVGNALRIYEMGKKKLLRKCENKVRSSVYHLASLKYSPGRHFLRRSCRLPLKAPVFWSEICKSPCSTYRTNKEAIVCLSSLTTQHPDG